MLAVEPPTSNHPLSAWTLRIVLTPHVALARESAQTRISQQQIDMVPVREVPC